MLVVFVRRPSPVVRRQSSAVTPPQHQPITLAIHQSTNPPIHQSTTLPMHRPTTASHPPTTPQPPTTPHHTNQSLEFEVWDDESEELRVGDFKAFDDVMLGKGEMVS